MRGRARVQQSLLPAADRFDFDKLVEKLDKSFDTEVDREMACSALPRRIQRPGETVRQFADAIFALARRAYSSMDERPVMEARLKEQLWNGITDVTMKSRLRDYKENHPRFSTQEAVDHLSLHDPRDVAARIPAMAANLTKDGNVHLLEDSCEGDESTNSDWDSYEYDYFQEDTGERRRPSGSAVLRGPRRRGGFTRRAGNGALATPRTVESGVAVRGSEIKEELSSRGGRTGTRMRGNFVGSNDRFMTHGAFLAVVDGMRAVAIQHRDRPPVRVERPGSSAVRGNSSWQERAGTKPFQNRSAVPRANLCRGCGLFTSEDLSGRCSEGEIHFCGACGDSGSECECQVCSNDRAHGVNMGQTFTLYDELENA